MFRQVFGRPCSPGTLLARSLYVKLYLFERGNAAGRGWDKFRKFHWEQERVAPEDKGELQQVIAAVCGGFTAQICMDEELRGRFARRNRNKGIKGNALVVKGNSSEQKGQPTAPMHGVYVVAQQHQTVEWDQIKQAVPLPNNRDVLAPTRRQGIKAQEAQEQLRISLQRFITNYEASYLNQKSLSLLRNRKEKTVDLIGAIHLLEAASHHFAPAAFNLALVYHFGLFGCPQDLKRAEKLYGRAGIMGHLDALYNLACLYWETGQRRKAEMLVVFLVRKKHGKAVALQKEISRDSKESLIVRLEHAMTSLVQSLLGTVSPV